MKQSITLILLLSSALSVFSKDVNITDFDAVGDGITDNTVAIQRAIDYCAETGGGTVLVPAGTFISGSIFLKSNITLHISRSAILKGIPKLDSYPGAHFLEKGFIRIDGVENITIEGEGIIDGSGDHQIFQQGEGGNNRPYLVHAVIDSIIK